MKINWSSIEPVLDQATLLRGDFTAKSEIVKLAEQQAEIERLRKENARLREALQPFADRLDELEKMNASKYACAAYVEVEDLRAAAAAIREGGKDDAP